MSEEELRRCLRHMNPGQLRRVILALAVGCPEVVERVVRGVCTPGPIPVEGQLELDQ